MLIQCSSAQEAVTVYEHLDEGIDLILSDILMPGMNGKIMVELIKSKINRATKAIIPVANMNNSDPARLDPFEQGLH